MRSPVTVRVEWQAEKIHSLPSSLRYVTVAKFDEDAETWTQNAWSVVLEFTTPPSGQGVHSVATAKFLAPVGPWERLSHGKKFEFYEGKTLSAVVTVL